MMTDGPWILRGGTLVDPEGGEIQADLRCEDGVIKAIGLDLDTAGCQVYDATGKHVFPGFIDTHVHLGYKRSVAEDLVSETRSAAAGGVTTVCHFAKVLRHRDEQMSFHQILDELTADIESLSYSDVLLHLHLTNFEQIEEIASYAARGFTSFKLYLSYKDDPGSESRGTIGVGDGEVYAALAETAKVPGTLIMVHCENWDLVKYFERVQGIKDPSFIDFSNAHPGIAEADHIRRVAYYASTLDVPVYIVHVSSEEGLIAAAEHNRTQSNRVFVETCPQYLTMTKEHANTLPGAMAKTTPPVRSQAHLDALWKGIEDGTVQTVGSDHAACPLHDKERVSDGVAGFPSIEVAMPLVITEGIRRNIDLRRIAQICSYNAAEILGILPKKGTLRIGSDADLAVIDINTLHPVEASGLHSDMGYTPFEEFPIVTVDATFLRGSPVWMNGAVEEKPTGRIVLRDNPDSNPSWVATS